MNIRVTCGISCALVAASTVVGANQNDAPGPKDTLEEVVVTALKRTEDLQKVPVAVTALSQEFIEKHSPQTLSDIAADIPGLAILGGDPGTASLAIRGISSSGADLTTAATVGYYFGDTPVTLGNSTDGGQIEPSYFDVARVEVLRGPQGTLYGASSMGGTIRVVFNEPQLSAFDSKFAATLSNTAYGGWNYEADGMVNIPFGDDLAVRASGFQREMSGYINRILNTQAGANPDAPPFTQVEGDANAVRAQGARLTLLYKPTDVLSIQPEVFYQRTEFASGSEIDINLSPSSALNVNNPFPEGGQDTVTIPSLTVKASFPTVELTSNTAYYDRFRNQAGDYSEFDSAEIASAGVNGFFPAQAFPRISAHQFSEELRATSQDSGPLHWLAGLFYESSLTWDAQYQLAYGLEQATGGSFLGFPDPDGLTFGKDESLRATQKAAFGEVSYDVLSGLKATVGLRYFEFNNDFNRTGYGPEDGGTQTEHLTASASGVNPKFLVSYDLATDKMLYASATKGFRSGGVNEPVPISTCAGDLAAIGLSAAPESFGPDSVWSYELGEKSDWLDHRLRVNVAAYDIQWSQIQENVNLPTCGWSFIANTGTASSKGVEVELAATPLPGLTARIVGSYDNATNTTELSYTPGSQGASLLEVPKETGAASIEYVFPVGAGTTSSVRAEYKYYGSVLQGYIVAPNQWVPGYGTLGLGAGVVHDHYSADLFVHNLTNERGYYSLAYLPFLIHNYDRGYIIPPRIIGLTVTYKY